MSLMKMLIEEENYRRVERQGKYYVKFRILQIKIIESPSATI